MSVLQYLQKSKLKTRIFQATSFGEHRPVATNETPEGRRSNRRVEIYLKDRTLEASAGVDSDIITFETSFNERVERIIMADKIKLTKKKKRQVVSPNTLPKKLIIIGKIFLLVLILTGQAYLAYVIVDKYYPSIYVKMNTEDPPEIGTCQWISSL